MLTKYITEGIETLFNADLLNYIVKKFNENGWDVNWNKLTKEEYWSKVAPLVERTNLSQSNIEQRILENKKELIINNIVNLAQEYSPLVNIDNLRTENYLKVIRESITQKNLPYTENTPENSELIRKSYIFNYYKQRIDSLFAQMDKTKNLIKHTKKILATKIHYKHDTNNPYFREIFDDLYEYFKSLIDGKRPAPIPIDDHLKAVAQEHIRNHIPKQTQSDFFNQYHVWWQNSKRLEKELYKVYSDEYDRLDDTQIRQPKAIPQINFNRGIGYKTDIKRKKLKKTIYNIDSNDNLALSTNRFPVKANKKYQLHMIAPPHSFIIDLMIENNEIYYLICININTRKLFAQATNLNEQMLLKKDEKKTSDAYLNALKLIMKQTKITYLRGDGEKAFNSIKAKSFYKAHHMYFQPVSRQITKYPKFMSELNMVKAISSEPTHASLGIIDRVIRTIRDLAFNLKIGLITPDAMRYIVVLYNNAPHETLSHFAGQPVSPNEVDSDEDLQAFIMRRIQQDNINKITQEGFGLTPGVPVKVYNERNAMAKRRSELEPGHWHVVGRDGMKFIIEDENGKQQTKARCKIANTWE